MSRAGDKEGVAHFQSDRFFTSDGQWYFATREVLDQGPFVSRRAAEKALDDYLKIEIGVDFKSDDPWNDPTLRR